MLLRVHSDTLHLSAYPALMLPCRPVPPNLFALEGASGKQFPLYHTQGETQLALVSPESDYHIAKPSRHLAGARALQSKGYPVQGRS